jgi:quercetin dioxygenase-like cupin family protein
MLRIVLVVAAGVTTCVGGLALAQHGQGGGKGPEVKVVSAVDIVEELGGKEARATTFEVTFRPGAAGAPQRHPGPIFGYVIEGEFEFAVGNEKPRRLKAGESFYEPAMALHAVSRNPSDRNQTRVLALLIHPRDAKELVIPEPARNDR